MLRRRCEGAIVRDRKIRRSPRCGNELGVMENPRIVVLGM